MRSAVVLLAIAGATAPGLPFRLLQTTPEQPQDQASSLLNVPNSSPFPPGAPRAPDRDMVLRWNETALEAVKADRTPPPLAARNLAILHAAVYDAVNAIDGGHCAFRVDVDPLPGACPEVAAATAAHRVLVDLYPAQVNYLDAALKEALAGLPEGSSQINGANLGQFVADRMLAWRSADGADEPAPYQPGTGPGLWQPTAPGYRPALLPQWPRVTCFAMRDGAQFRPGAPPPLTSAAYTASFNEVKALGARASTARTAEQTKIAWFWADGDGTVTPPGHWNRIAQEVARERGNSLAENARLFALLNLALADAGIVAWDCKFHYQFWRPVQAIREADADGNPDTAAEPGWTPLLPTPPFPSFTSGHSTFSAAAATVLSTFYGRDDLRFTTASEALPGVRRSFPGFSAAAEEAGRSRIYGGIHWGFDNTEGLATGGATGRYVCQHFLLPQQQSRTCIPPAALANP